MKKSELNQNTTPGMKQMFDFLTKLSKNNNRDWFNEHKDEFFTQRSVFEFMVQELIDGISQFDERIKGVQAKGSIFRIYRDTRFSHDKTPYKTHFGAWITKGGRKSEYPGYYLHISPEGSFIGAGIWHPDPKLLKMIRRDIFNNMDDFINIVKDKEFVRVFGDVQSDERLKTVPKEFPKDTPNGEYLKLKDYYVGTSLTQEFFDEQWVSKACDKLKVAYPFNMFLDEVVNDFVDA